jgi:hypothetical protein
MSAVASQPPPGLDPDALEVALAVAPGVYSRNQMFAFYKDPRMARARSRARLVRGVAREIGRAAAGGHAPVVRELVEHGATVKVVYGIPNLRFTRQVELSRLELATLRYLLQKAGAEVASLACTAEDRALVESTLQRLHRN